MSKAILVIDMPDSCSKCKFIYEFQGKKKCQLMNALNGGFSMISQNNFTVRRHEKCPLVPFSDTKQDTNNLPASEFISYILCTICDYAKENNYQITDTVKTMGENLVALSEIATFDNWKGSGTDE